MKNPLAAFKERLRRATRPKKPRGMTSASMKLKLPKNFGGMKFGKLKGY